MPWTGGAFLVGAMAIAGLPPLNGFASEWLTLQALLHVPAYGGIGDGLAGAIALAALAATAALAVLLLRQGRRSRAARPAAARRRGRRRRGAARRCAPRVVVLARRLCRARARARVARSACSAGWRPGTPAAPTDGSACTFPGTGSLPTIGIAVALVALTGVLRRSLRGRRRRRARSGAGRAASSSSRQLNWTSAGFTKPLRLVLETVLRPAAGDRRARRRAASSRRSSYSGRVPHLIDERRLPAGRGRSRSRGAHHARRLQTGRLGTYVAYLIGARARSARRREARGDRMSGAALASAPSQIVGGFLLAPLLPGLDPALEGAAAGPPRAVARSSPTASCAGCGARAPSTSEGSGVVYRLAPRGRRRQRRRRGPARPRRVGSRRARRRPRRARARSACSRSHVSPLPSPPGMLRTASRSWARAVT